MHPPKNKWDWVGGHITHFDMTVKLRKDLKYIIDAYRGEGDVKPEYFDDDDDDDIDWGDYAFRWLNHNENKVFHLPGPSPGKRCEFLNHTYSVRSNIMFTVAKGTVEYDEYMAHLDRPREWLC